MLKGITLDLEPGSVTALAGENGAGKSTLMKIVSGQYSADGGIGVGAGHPPGPGNPRDAVKHGVAIVPQELASIEDMTVYENLFVGRELATGPFLEPQGDDRRGQGDAGGVRRGHLADRADGQSAGRAAADRGDRQGRPHRRAGRDARRADLRHLRARGRGPVRDRAPPARPRRRDGLHHAQDGRDPCHRRPRRGAARRRTDPRQAAGRGVRRRHRHRDDRPRTGRPVPDRVAPKADPVLEVRDLQVDGASEPVSFSVSARRDPRSRRAGRCGPNRAAGGHLRRQAHQFRRDPGARQERQAQRARGGDHRGHGDGPRGPQDLRCRAVDERARQRIAPAAVVVQHRRVAARQGQRRRPFPT